jgi:hypothetical protein
VIGTNPKITTHKMKVQDLFVLRYSRRQIPEIINKRINKGSDIVELNIRIMWGKIHIKMLEKIPNTGV